MNLRDFVKLLRSRWMSISAVTAAAILAALLYSSLATPLYLADTRLYVAAGGGRSVSEDFTGNLFSQERVKSYTKLLTGQTLAQRTITQLGLPMSPATLSARVSASAQPDRVLISVRVLDESPTRARDIANALSDQFAVMVREIETPQTGKAPNARVVVEQRASVPSKPALPRTKRNLIAGLMGGLLLGIWLAVLRDRLDNTVSREETLEEITGVGLVGRIPFDKHALTFDKISPGVAESFRRLRTNLQFLSVDHPPRTIAITSSMANEGKSTTAINLAIALAEAEYSVVLVDADLRRPSLDKYLGLVGSAGFSTVLSGGSSLADVLQQTKFPNLTVLTAGTIPPNPTELLGSLAAKSLLAELREQFDYVIIDTPPVVAVTDAVVMATNCDGVLLMCRSGHTKRDLVTYAVKALNDVGAKLLGGVLTMATSQGDNYYDYVYSEEARAAAHNPPAINTPVVVGASQTASRPLQRTKALVERPSPPAGELRGPAVISHTNSALNGRPGVEALSSAGWDDKARSPIERPASPAEGPEEEDANSVRLNLPLMALPTAIGLVNIYYPAAVAAVALLCTAALVTSNASARIRLTGAALILPVVGAAVAFRPNIPGGMASVIFYVLACTTVVLTVITSNSRSSAILSLFDGIGLLLLAAVALRTAGISGTGLILTIKGNMFTGGERAIFALAGTWTMAPAVAAAYLVAAVPIIRNYSKYRGYRLILAGVAVYVLVMSDRRSALYAVVLIAVLTVLAPRRLRQIAPWIVGIVLLQPFIYRRLESLTDRASLQQFFNALPLSRPGESVGESTFGTRLEIWSRSLDFYYDRVNSSHQAFGFGTFGQAESGASYTYRQFFLSDPNSTTKTTHNSVLQTLFDAGWIGAAAFVIAVIWAARMLSRRSSPTDMAALAMLLTFSISGATESLFAPGYPQAPPWWIGLAIAVIAFSEETSTIEKPPDPRRSADSQFDVEPEYQK